MLTYHKMAEEEKYRIADWKYEGKYEIYNMISYEEQKEKGFGFANEKNKLYSFYDKDTLIGFINLYEEEKEVFFGIGVHPDFCNRGYGQEMTKIACKLSNEIFPLKPLYLEVRTWNLRAVKCYEKAGFKIDGEKIYQKTYAGVGEFYRMVKKKNK